MSAGHGNVAQRCRGRQHEALGALYAAPNDVLMRRAICALAEGDIEVKRAQASHGSKIAIANSAVQICLDMGQNPPQLPWGKPALRHRAAGTLRGRCYGLEQLCNSL